MALTRTQISLSEAQHRFLQRLARRRGTSMADVVRSLVEKEMQAEAEEERLRPDTITIPEDHPWKDDPLWKIIGVVSSGEKDAVEGLDRLIYRKDWE